MSTLSAPLIQRSIVEPSSKRYESAPPWLLSMVIHMALVIALGMIQIGMTPGNNLKLLFLPAESLSATEADTSGLADLDVPLSAYPASFSTVDDVAAPLAASEMLTSLDGDWNNLISSDSGAPSLIPGLGEGTLGEGVGGTGRTSLVGLAGEGGKFVYVFDRSESMNSIFTLYSQQRVLSTITPLLSAKMEMARSLGALSKASEFQIVFYNDTVEIFGAGHYDQKLFRATNDNKQMAREYIENTPGEGFTNHLLALDAAMALEPDVIFLLTDGEAKDDLHPNMVRKIAKFCQRRNIVINVVHFCNSPRGNCTLVPLAEKTGGQHVFISLESLAAALVDPVAL
ncbi:MAG: hypothetical protein SH868_06165 [Bythopirellula sp.]|nr:hypothetical protein [Bythopirellula sp.]